MRCTSLLVALSLTACLSTESGPPEIITGPHNFNDVLVPVFATDTTLYFNHGRGNVPANAIPSRGLWTLNLVSTEVDGTLDLSSLMDGVTYQARREGNDLVAVIRDFWRQTPTLVRTPLGADGVSATSPLPWNAMATAAADGYTYVAENHPEDGDRVRIVRLATATEPELVLVDDETGFLNPRGFCVQGGRVYWTQSAWVRHIAADGSETDVQYGAEPASLGSGDGGMWDWLLGTIGDEVYVLRNWETWIETGGEWSNGDPKGYYGFGGGDLYTTGPQPRLVHSGIRNAVIAGDVIIAQNLDLEIVRIDPTTGSATVVYSDKLPASTGTTPYAANSTTLFFGGYDSDTHNYTMHAVPLD